MGQRYCRCTIRSHFETISLGEHHRKQRKLLNPVFSAKHMRSLTPVFYKVTDKVCPLLFC